jgi:hypothetical protein
MGQHGALAAAGGTTGVEDGRELVGGAVEKDWDLLAV